MNSALSIVNLFKYSSFDNSLKALLNSDFSSSKCKDDYKIIITAEKFSRFKKICEIVENEPLANQEKFLQKIMASKRNKNIRDSLVDKIISRKEEIECNRVDEKTLITSLEDHVKKLTVDIGDFLGICFCFHRIYYIK